MRESSYVEDTRVVRNFVRGDANHGVASTFLQIEGELGNTTTLGISSGFDRGRFSLISAISVHGVLSDTFIASFTTDLMTEFRIGQRSGVQGMTTHLEASVSEAIAAEHIRFIRESFYEEQLRIAEYKLTSMFYSLIQALGVKRPALFLSSLFEVSLTSIQRRVATGRSRGVIFPPRQRESND